MRKRIGAWCFGTSVEISFPPNFGVKDGQDPQLIPGEKVKVTVRNSRR